ncbi:uncharacterized protein F5891DRAFT_1187806 [Suillus fuscotomentosus]|uniref:Uncharacterized protein n=1 Tax=Suillus fuscotomentosus TaxID=1912939 RepID=A0AAD4HLK8_9AGAM|nr:uncharacterized protein F5891DRAFT_1187806 [Suillus fuscotomentosus]KAG1901108.1 hypothetical protein F5891DRAFT_1187806 [Suillus fuscotomentosus]
MLKSCLGLLTRLRPELIAKKVFQEIDDEDSLAVYQFRILASVIVYIRDRAYGEINESIHVLGKKQQKSAGQLSHCPVSNIPSSTFAFKTSKASTRLLDVPWSRIAEMQDRRGSDG